MLPTRILPLLAAQALFAAACAVGGDAPEIAPTEPHVKLMESGSLAVGEMAYFFGDNFLEPDEGRTLLEFEGIYLWTDDQGNQVPEHVNGFTVAPIYDGEFTDTALIDGQQVPPGTGVLRLSRFGPFQVPFGAQGRRPGTFTGLIRAVNVYEDGTELRDPNPSEFTIEVERSVLITRLEPITGFSPQGEAQTAQCAGPAVRVFGGIPYILEVEAMGFEPAYFIYELANVQGDAQVVSYQHTAQGPVDSLGDPAVRDDEILMFNILGDDDGQAIAAIRVTAVGVDNQYYETALPLAVVRPIAFHHDGARHIAQYYEPQVVHGPLTGSIGTVISYNESHSESRMRGVSVSLTESFTQSQGTAATANWSEAFQESKSTSTTNSVGQSHSESETSSETFGADYTTSEANSVNLSSTDGTSWGWNMSEGETESSYQTQVNEAFQDVSFGVSTEVGAEGSVPGFAKVSGKVGTQAGTTVGGKESLWSNQTQGTNKSHGSNMGGSASDTQAFGSTTTDSKSSSFSGTFALSAQSTISASTAETSASSESMTYQMGGSESITANFSQGSQQTWQETWQETSTEQTLFSMSSKVPNGMCAVVYRQAVRHVRVGHLYRYDLCGVRSLVGELYFNDWSWSPNIAIGQDCDSDLPESTLPKAACFHACD